MIQIRKAKVEEVNLIIDFQQKMAWETEKLKLDENELTAGVRAVFHDSAKGCYFVALEDNIIIGSLMITYEWSDWRNRTVYWIQSVYVLPEHRQKGVYKALYAHILSLMNEDEKVGGVRLYVDKSNRIAQTVYTKMGMNGDHYQLFERMKGI